MVIPAQQDFPIREEDGEEQEEKKELGARSCEAELQRAWDDEEELMTRFRKGSQGKDSQERCTARAAPLESSEVRLPKPPGYPRLQPQDDAVSGQCSDLRLQLFQPSKDD